MRKSENLVVLRVMDVDGVGGLAAVENGRIYGKGMNAARQISRKIGSAGREYWVLGCQGLPEGAKGLTLHPSRGLPKRGQRVYPRSTGGSESAFRRLANGKKW